MNIYNFKKIFYSLICKNETKSLLNLMDILIKKKILTEEIAINLIKGMILIFYLDKSLFKNYYDIFYEICFNFEEEDIKILKEIFHLINFSTQFKINDYFIENIIIYTNYIVIDNSIKLKDRIKKLKNYINRINNLKLSFEFKIHLYIFFIKNYNNIEFDDNTLSTIINFIKIN